MVFTASQIICAHKFHLLMFVIEKPLKISVICCDINWFQPIQEWAVIGKILLTLQICSTLHWLNYVFSDPRKVLLVNAPVAYESHVSKSIHVESRCWSVHSPQRNSFHSLLFYPLFLERIFSPKGLMP